MRIELNNRRSTAGFIAVSLALAIPYFWWITQHYRASASSADLSLDGLQQAVRLDPANAEYHDMLGRYYLYVSQDALQGAAQFQRAAALDPHSSRYWLDLASAKGLSGDVADQRSALQTALHVDPKTPKTAWEVGNFFLVDGNAEVALDSFKAAIQYDPVSVRPALELCWRATHDVNMILAHAMPKDLSPHMELLRMLYEQNQPDAAMTTWRALVGLNQQYKVTDAMPFVDYLIRQHRIADAQEVWSSLAKISASLRPSTSDGNLIVNGSFDEDIIPGGFSWRLQAPALQNTRLDSQELHTGTASLALDFEGPAFRDYGLSQLVPVRPNQLYELKVTAKSQEIQSAEGPRVMVEDEKHIVIAKGEEWQGTHGWDEQSILFTTPPGTELVRVYVGRVTGAGLIRGRLWLDNFRMYER
jgi:hypothetical protein